MIVFRSLVIPVKAAVGFLLSVGASLGLVVAVFQWGWLADTLGVPHSGPVVSFLPIILIGVLFGLAMDYEVFLVSGMREEWAHTGRARQSVVDGARHSVRVVTAAALIMFTVFAGFFPLDDSLIKPIAFALAVGVAIDAFAVRMTLVPAVLALAGRGAWWLPAWLDRILPDLDVEGTSLQRAAPADRKEPQPVA
jgi:RND superfamily putative drug exporter